MNINLFKKIALLNALLFFALGITPSHANESENEILYSQSAGGEYRSSNIELMENSSTDSESTSYTSTLDSIAIAGSGKNSPQFGVRIGTCTSSSDYVHITRGEASGHAWWSRNGKNCNVDKATIRIRLQVYKNGSWTNVTSDGYYTLKPGTSKRANARKACLGNRIHTWRTAFEVDYHGVVDPIEWNYSVPRNLPCGI